MKASFQQIVPCYTIGANVKLAGSFPFWILYCITTVFLQYIIGHTDIRTTMRVYNHVDEGRVKREMDKLEEFGKKLTPNFTPIYISRTTISK